MKRSQWLILGVFLLSAAFTFVLKVQLVQNGDPDRFYHIALSRITADSSRLFLRELPQVEDLGWNQNFVDKEFLFHQLTTLGYRLGGERGVVEATFFCALASLLLFYAFAAARLSPALAVLASLLTFSSPLLVFRLALLRPHVLAIFAFIFLNFALLNRRPKLTAFAAFVFVLSYHAFYVPVFCLIWIALLSFLETKERAKEWRRLAGYGLLGSLAGLLLNPYFPGNLVMAFIHARIPELMQGELKGLNFGTELSPTTSDDHFRIFHGAMLVIGVALFFLGRVVWGTKEKEERNVRVPLLYLLGLAGLFLYLSFQTIRAGEYLLPACGFLVVLLLEQYRKHEGKALLLCAVLASLQLLHLGSLFRARALTFDLARVSATFSAIGALPQESKGAKVFNCEWDRTPYLLYARPDLRFVDILDPSLLYFAQPAAFRAREDLRKGLVADAYGMIRHAFHADYVLCNDQNVVNQLRDDPSFQQIFPPTISSHQPLTTPTVFRLAREPHAAYVRKLTLAALGRFPLAKLPEWKPGFSVGEKREVDLAHSPYLNLAPVLAEKWEKQKSVDEGDFACALLSPATSEAGRLAGATYLALGGGQGFQVWRNGQNVFRTQTGFASAHNTQVVIPLGNPLRAGDRLEILVCSPSAASFWGVSLSLWTEATLGQTCEWKAKALLGAGQPEWWPREGIHGQTCIGFLAGEGVPRLLRTRQK